MNEDKMIEMLKEVPLKNEHFSLQNELWREIREQIFNGSKTRNFSFNIIWKVAACVAIILSSYFVITSEKTFVTNDNILAVTLPDGSTVDMEPYSELKFNRIKWLFKRDMQFTGEGMFVVNKGSKFSVITDMGTISVLGTKFSVEQRDEVLKVECYEGVILVVTKSGEIILNKGDKIDYRGEKLELIPSELWKEEIKEKYPDIIIFEDLKLIQVIEKLEKIFNIKVIGKEKYSEYSYSGFTPTSDIEEALDIVFSSCGIEYTYENSIVTLN